MSIFDSISDMVGGVIGDGGALGDAAGAITDNAAVQDATDAATALAEDAGTQISDLGDQAATAAEDVTSELGL